ncbi:MAG TPA: CRISPR-associated endonuclease Cas1 [Thermomicrobiales bacterium]|nr:CRISPR-associated endonuclease Cas1 [Thermomicrobiales bacterium]
MRSVEDHAAAAYWSAWTPATIRFAKRDQAKVPEHWKTFGTRSSPISGATRNASNPLNALLNYVYAILETEVRLAILTMGLDPGMGILHADLKSRDSFVFDVIEPLRSEVDGYLLTMLEERTFAAREFFETRQGCVGSCRRCRRSSPRWHRVWPSLWLRWWSRWRSGSPKDRERPRDP